MRRRRFGDLFEQVASLGNLFAAAKKALRGRGLRMPAVAFAADLETEVVALAHELRSGSYCPGAYHYFEILEPKRRLVAAAPRVGPTASVGVVVRHPAVFSVGEP